MCEIAKFAKMVRGVILRDKEIKQENLAELACSREVFNVDRLTFQVLIVVNFAHIVVNFSPLSGRDVRGRVLSFMHELFEEGVDLAAEGLSIQCTLHCCGLLYG